MKYNVFEFPNKMVAVTDGHHQVPAYQGDIMFSAIQLSRVEHHKLDLSRCTDEFIGLISVARGLRNQGISLDWADRGDLTVLKASGEFHD